MKIIIETETAAGPNALFRVEVNDKLVNLGMSPIEAHELVGEILELAAQRKTRHAAQKGRARQRSTARFDLRWLLAGLQAAPGR